MRIAFIISALGPGGAEHVVRNLATGLARQDCEVLIFAIRKYHDRKIVEERYGELWATRGVTVIEASDRPVRSLRAAIDAGRQLRAALASFGPDVVHSHCELPDLLTSAYARRLPAVRIRTSHIDPYFSGYVPPAIGRLLENAMNVLGGWRHVIAVSNRTRRINRRTAPTTLIHNGLSNHDGPPPAAARSTNDGTLQLAVVGALCGRKGQLALLRHLTSRYPAPDAMPFAVSFYGVGPDGPALADAAQRFGERVRVHGWIADRDEIYAGRDVVVIPSDAEGLSSVMVEAVTRGVPVLSFRVSGADDIISQWGCGRIVSGYGELFDILEQRAIPKVGIEARAWLARTFSVATCTKRHLDLYKQLVSGADGHSSARTRGAGWRMPANDTDQTTQDAAVND